jgi:hypothetical protein
LIADIMLVVGQAVLTVTDELMIRRAAFQMGNCLLNREKYSLQVYGDQLSNVSSSTTSKRPN